MFTLKFDNFEVPVKDYLLDDDWIIIDTHLATKEDFNKFSAFHLEHHFTDDYLLNFTLDNASYHGSFGTYTYDPKFNIRLHMSTIPLEKSYDSETAFSVNLPKILENHEKRLTVLTEALKRNNLLNEDEILSLDPYLSIDNFIFAMYRQVPDLNKYLKDTHSTLEELRKK
jgi:hypothetical protein